MRKLVYGILAALLMTAAPTLALADAAGSALGVKPSADADHEGVTQTLKVGSDVFIGDLVKTGDKGQVQILFADNTKLVVGPHSSLKIEDYLLRNNGSAGKLAVDMLGGSFRFATGDAPKNRYVINTPTGTIGVRGTRFDVFVASNGVTRILHYEGVVRFCTRANKCEVLSKLCTLGQLSNDATIIGDSTQIQGRERDQLKADFIYSNNQAPLLTRFRFPNAYGCTHNPPNVPVFTPDPSFQGTQPVPPPPPPPPPDNR